MNNNKSLIDSLVGVLGVVTLTVIVYNAIKSITNKTETNVISDKALKVIKEPEEAIKLRKAIDKYHETGDWKDTEISNIL